MDSTPRPRRAPYVPISRRQQPPAESHQPRPRQPMSPPETKQSKYHQPRSPPETQQPLSRQPVSPPDSQSSPNNVASGSRAPSERSRDWGPESHRQEVSRQRQLMTPPDSQKSPSNVASGSRRPSESARDTESYQSMSRQPTSPPDVQNSSSNVNYDLTRRTNAPWRGPRAREKGSREAKRGEIYVHSPEYGRRERDNRAPSVQPHSSQPGPNRDGWSERKCRTTLVRLCSHIPRNLNYRDGYHKVVYILRDVVGDENLDLALGVLFELIEVNDTVDTWEEGSPYRRWTHDHWQRHADLCCHHTVRLTNVVMGAHVPTEKLIQWRKEQHRKHLAASFNPSTRRFRETGVIDGVVTTTTGIRNRQSWQINHSVYVSTPNGGTRVIFCPTPAQVNAMAFHEGVARGERHHAATLPSSPAEVVARPSTFNNLPSTPPPTPTLPVVVEKKSSKLKRSFKKVGGKLMGAFCVRRSKSAERAEEDIALAEMAGSPGRSSDTIDDEENKVAELSPEVVKEYINADGSKRVVLENFPLPVNAQVNGLFMRKHCLIDDDAKDLPEDIANLPFYTAEEKALRDELALKLSMRSPGDTNADVLNIRTTFKPFKGPFTADLFKDGGLDFKWKPAVETVVEEEDVISPAPRR